MRSFSWHQGVVLYNHLLGCNYQSLVADIHSCGYEYVNIFVGLRLTFLISDDGKPLMDPNR
jgi:hypothetical protein